jgi:GH15 family glucan-1,4-alpha-glucosidase
MPAESTHSDFYPRLADYGVLGDGHTAALVSKVGSIDFCCMPRFDSGTCFGRLLDWRAGGFWAVEGDGEPLEAIEQTYVDDAMVLRTELGGPTGRLVITDALLLGDEQDSEARCLLRRLECVEGELGLRVRVRPRFDYGQLRPWIYPADGRWVAIGGDDALIFEAGGDVPFEREPDHLDGIFARLRLARGERTHVAMRYVRPHRLDSPPPRASVGELERRLEETSRRWRDWARRANVAGARRDGVVRSALAIKALTYEPTGAVVAAATTSLPEAPDGELNWDYRFSWIRDAIFCVRTLSDLGYDTEASRFRRFVERSSAGDADELRVAYGVRGERRLAERELTWLDGYRAARPVRVGNAAVGQLQLGIYGMLLDLAWCASEQGRSPDAEYGRFLVSTVDCALRLWPRADSGLWEKRGEPLHFTHSKAMCWAALDRGLRLAQRHGWDVPADDWRRTRDAIRAIVERDGYDARRGTFTQTLGGTDLDATVLLLPRIGFVADDDPRMVGTVDAIRSELGVDGLLYRQSSSRGCEGAFLACSFWLVECLVGQGRCAEAEQVFERAAATANHVGLFPEEWEPLRGEPLGNLPQGLTHYSHIAAAMALDASNRRRTERARPSAGSSSNA